MPLRKEVAAVVALKQEVVVVVARKEAAAEPVVDVAEVGLLEAEDVARFSQLVANPFFILLLFHSLLL